MTRRTTLRDLLGVLGASCLLVAITQRAPDPTFVIYKYQHIVGDETDQCESGSNGRSCQARFQLRFTGSSIVLDATVRTGSSGQPIAFSAHGQNSTRSFVDLDVTLDGRRATIVERGSSRAVTAPAMFFTLQEDAPFVAQEMLLAYWQTHGRPARLPLLPSGEVRIWARGASMVTDAAGSPLTRYTVHGVTWGDETVWLSSDGALAAVVGTDAEEDRVEVVRPWCEPRLKTLAAEAAADAVADTEAARASARSVARGSFALTHATVINPGNGQRLDGVTVEIADGRISAMGAGLTLPASMTRIDVKGRFVLPGLWDTHAHFEQWEWGPANLAAGITSVRDVGNEIEFLVPIRRALNAGRGLGPRMYAAGLIDSDPGSLTSEHAEDADRARAIVQRYHDLGYEEMKIYQSLKPDLIAVVADEAHRLGMQVTGHIPTGATAWDGIRDGMDQINHIGFLTRVMRPPGATDLRADSAEARETISLLLAHHTVIEPTLARGEFNLHPRSRAFAEIDPAAAWLPPELAIILNNAGVTADRETRAVASLETALDTTRILHQAGVPILAGTDQVIPGASLHRELELLVRAGFTPLEALRSATVIPARVLGVTDAGEIATGQRADLVILEADPLADISNVRRVYGTVVGGTLYLPRTLWGLVDIREPPTPGASF